MDINTSDIYEPDSDPQITSPLSSQNSGITCNTDSCCEPDQDNSSVLITDEDENWLQSSTSDDDFGCSPIVYSSDECGDEGAHKSYLPLTSRPKAKKSCESDSSFLELKGTRFYIHLKNQPPRVRRNIEGILSSRGAYICTILCQDVTHLLTDQDNLAVKGYPMSKANCLPTNTRSMRMVEECCQQNNTINMLNLSLNATAEKLEFTTVALSDIFSRNDLRRIRVSDPDGHAKNLFIENLLRFLDN